MSQVFSKEGSRLSTTGLLVMVSAAGAISIALIGLFSMGLLSLELVLAISFLPLVAWVFFHHQELVREFYARLKREAAEYWFSTMESTPLSLLQGRL